MPPTVSLPGRCLLGRAAAASSLSIALLTALAPPAACQRVASNLELGGSIVRYADSVDASAATLSPALRLDADHVTLGAAGTFSQLARGWSTQGGLYSSVFTPAAGVLLGEVSGFAGGSAHADGARTGQALGVARAHLMRAGHGAWAGAGVGTTWDGIAWHPVRTAELGAWSYVGMSTALVTITPTAVSDTLRYTDAELALRFDLPRVEFGLTGGARAGDRLPTSRGSSSVWGSASATAWIAPAAALVASIGSYPLDLTQGFPGGRFVSFGVRFGPRASHHDRNANGAPPLVSSLGTTTRRSGETTPDDVLEVRVGGADGRSIRVHAPRAASVEIMGDFTNWAPARLVPDGTGWWTTASPLEPGTHEMNVRANGSRWQVPPGLTSVEDEFGGSVGLLVVR